MEACTRRNTKSTRRSFIVMMASVSPPRRWSHAAAEISSTQAQDQTRRTNSGHQETWTRTRCWAARWLDVLEKGELDDKKEIDESPLTARQKALLHKQQSQTLLELPMGYREEELTAEMMQKREERARKRRLQAAKKAEENKNQTIERLTKTKSKKKGKSKQAQLPMVRYSSNVQGAAVSYPAGIPVPTPTALPEPSPAPLSCSMS